MDEKSVLDVTVCSVWVCVCVREMEREKEREREMKREGESSGITKLLES